MWCYQKTAGRALKGGAALLVVLLLGCQDAPNLDAVRAEQSRPVHRYDTFQAVASNGKVIVAGTATGALAISADSGSTWKRQQLAGTASIIGLVACPDGRFVALDFYRKVWVADAPAQAWTARPIDTPDNVVALTCSPAGTLWVVGSRTRILHSTDMGATWGAQQAGEDAILTTVQFLDERHGHITGEFGLHLATQDAGVTWAKQAKLPGDFYPYATVFKDPGQAWTSGPAGVLLHTSDGGRTWAPQRNGAGVPIYGLAQLGDTVYGAGFGGQVVVLQEQDWVRYEHGKTVPAYLTALVSHGGRSLVLAGAAGALHVITPAVPLSAAVKQ